MANKPKGRASAAPKPPIPAVNCQALPLADKAFTIKEPRMIPVQEKETTVNVNAIKKMPPLLAVVLAMEEGSFISNKPKKDNAKKIKTAKKNTFTNGLVEIILNICGLILPMR